MSSGLGRAVVPTPGNAVGCIVVEPLVQLTAGSGPIERINVKVALRAPCTLADTSSWNPGHRTIVIASPGQVSATRIPAANLRAHGSPIKSAMLWHRHERAIHARVNDYAAAPARGARRPHRRRLDPPRFAHRRRDPPRQTSLYRNCMLPDQVRLRNAAISILEKTTKRPRGKQRYQRTANYKIWRNVRSARLSEK